MTSFELHAAITLLDIRELGLQCSQNLAEGRCAGIATHTVHWPSGDTRCCDLHVRRWREVGDCFAIFNLQMTPLPVWRAPDPTADDSATRFALMELT